MIDHTTYTIIYVSLAIAGFSFAASPNVIKSDKFSKQLIIVFSILLFFLFGSRCLDIGTDTTVYIRLFQGGYQFPDIGFNLFLNLLRLFSDNGRFLVYAISFVFMLPLCIFFCKISHENKFLLFLMFVNLFSFLPMGEAVLRQGIAVSFFFLATYYLKIVKNVTAGILFLVSLSFHDSAIVPIVLYLVSLRLKSLKIPLVSFFVASVLSILGFGLQEILNVIPILGPLSFALDRVDGLDTYALPWIYYYRVGFRLNFFIYNFFFAALGLFSYKYAIKFIPEYKTYLSFFLFTSAFFFLMFGLLFSDRMGLYSWVFIPFLMLPFIYQTGMFAKTGKLLALLLIISVNLYIRFS